MNKEKRIDHFNIGAWLDQAEDDYKAAKLDKLASFIRCFHAQQSIEKSLKALVIAKEGNFVKKSEKLMEKRRQVNQEIPRYMPDGAWELKKELESTHNLNVLVDRLQEKDDITFNFLDEYKPFLKELSEYAAVRRYPYYLEKVGMVVGYVETEKVELIMLYLDVLYPKIRKITLETALRN